MSVLTGIAILAGGVALVTAAGRFVSAIHRTARKFFHMIDDWTGEPARPGVSARPGFPERLAGLESDVQHIAQQLQPNSGETLRDAVDRVEAGQAHTHDREGTTP